MNIENTDDLFFLSSVLQNKNIVLLGEAEHSDETTFAYKTQIIKYLHENLGFDVLFFEAGRFEFDYLCAEHQHIDTLFFQNTLWNFWANSESCKQLFAYIDSLQYSENQMFVSGFDIQPSGNLFLPENFQQQKGIHFNRKIIKATSEYLQKKEN
ncbi:MAG: hypothetical protein LBB53_05665, partial [Prevotellaceae bacterium]|nr:hypothetical protein [Prevotellaceae bacterium]